MHVLVLSGSRNPQGQTATAIGAVAAGLAAGGVTSDVVFLPELALERCRQCDANGWGECRSAGHCIIEDDHAALVARLVAADAVVFATPVYFSDLAESLRAFLDRLRRLSLHESLKASLTGKPALGVCVAGGGGGGAPNCCANLERILLTCGFNLLDVVPVRRQNQSLKLAVLRTTGEWLASHLAAQA